MALRESTTGKAETVMALKMLRVACQIIVPGMASWCIVNQSQRFQK